MAVASQYRPFQNGMRSPVVAPVTRGLIAFPLFFLTTHTDKFFAWTIKPSLTAAILGANYIASTFLAIFASRKHLWAEGRVSVSVALVFAPITTAATFIHLNKFHLHSFFGWFWIVAYGIYPVMLAIYLVKQLKTPGRDPERTQPLPGWVKGLLALHGLLIPLGLIMFFSPSSMFGWWPWQLTPLTARALSAWVLAFGVLGVQNIWENDLRRVEVAFLTYPVFAVLHIVGLLRFSSDFRWGSLPGWAYLIFLVITTVLGVFGVIKYLTSRGARTVEPVVA